MREDSFNPTPQDFLLGADATLNMIGGFRSNDAHEIAPVALASALIGIGVELRRIADALAASSVSENKDRQR